MPTKRFAARILVVAAITAVLAVGCSGSPDDTSSSGGADTIGAGPQNASGADTIGAGPVDGAASADTIGAGPAEGSTH